MMIFILKPIVLVIAISFSEGYLVSFPPQGFTLSWYGQVLEYAAFTSALTFSVVLATCTTLLSLALVVVPVAFALERGDFSGHPKTL